MKNKLILVHHSNEITPELIQAQTRSIQRLLMPVHSLQTFLVSYELFNVKKHKVITKPKDITNLYYAAEPPVFHFVIGKN